jgi:hypothetical protein
VLSDNPRPRRLPDFATVIAINVNDGTQKTFHNSSIILDTCIRPLSIAFASLKRTQRDGQKKVLSVGENLKLKTSD